MNQRPQPPIRTELRTVSVPFRVEMKSGELTQSIAFGLAGERFCVLRVATVAAADFERLVVRSLTIDGAEQLVEPVRLAEHEQGITVKVPWGRQGKLELSRPEGALELDAVGVLLVSRETRTPTRPIAYSAPASELAPGGDHSELCAFLDRRPGAYVAPLNAEGYPLAAHRLAGDVPGFALEYADPDAAAAAGENGFGLELYDVDENKWRPTVPPAGVFWVSVGEDYLAEEREIAAELAAEDAAEDVL